MQKSAETYTIILTSQQLNLVAAGLKKLPWEMAEPVLVAVDAQVRAAMQPAEAEVADEHAEPDEA